MRTIAQRLTHGGNGMKTSTEVRAGGEGGGAMDPNG